LIWFWFLQVRISSLVNNLGFSCTNNMFLWVLILGFWFWIKTHFGKNHDVSVIIEVKGCLIFFIYAWLQTKLCFLLLEIWSDLMFTLLGLSLNVFHCLLCSLFSLVFYPFSLEIFMFFCVFLILICFGLNICSSLVLGETLVFDLIHGWTNVFGLLGLVKNRVKCLRFCLVCHYFDKKEFWLNGAFDKHFLRRVLTIYFE